MIKWTAIITLCFLLPFIGVPWLGYELWEISKQKEDDAFYDKLFDPIYEIRETDFANHDDYLSKINKILTIFETQWNTGTLFESAYKEPGQTLAKDLTTLRVAEKMWTINTYEKYCVNADREPVRELIEEWDLKVKAQQSGCQEKLSKLRQIADDVKSEIIANLKSGKTWQEARDQKSSNLVQVTVKNGTWTISYETELVLWTGARFAFMNKPTEIVFEVASE